MAIDLSKQKALDADPKAKQQINSTGNLEWTRNKQYFYKKLWEYYNSIFTSI